MIQRQSLRCLGASLKRKRWSSTAALQEDTDASFHSSDWPMPPLHRDVPDSRSIKLPQPSVIILHPSLAKPIDSQFSNTTKSDMMAVVDACLNYNDPQRADAILQKLKTAVHQDVLNQDEASQFQQILEQSMTNARLMPAIDPDTVRPTKTRGPGLKLLQKSLRPLTEDKQEYTRGVVSDIMRQRALEEGALASAMERWRFDYEELLSHGGVPVKGLNALLWEWHNSMLKLIQEELRRVDAAEKRFQENGGKRGRRSKIEMNSQKPDVAHEDLLQDGLASESSSSSKLRRLYGPFLRLVPPEKLSAITILELLKLHHTGGVAGGMRTTRALVTVGKAVELEYLSDQLRAQTSSNIARWNISHALQTSRGLLRILRKIRGLSGKPEDSAANQPPEHTSWTPEVLANIGAVLTSMLIHSAKVVAKGLDPDSGETVTSEMPAFHHTYQYLKGRKVGVIKLHESLMEKLSAEPLKGNVKPRLLPMVAPPQPWLSCDDGGYYYTRSSVMRTKEFPEQVQYLREASRRGHLNQIFESLDVLGQTAWKINRSVLDVVLRVWNSGEALADIPSYAVEPKFPDPLSNNVDPGARTEYNRACRAALQERNNAHSQRCDTNYKIEVARAFLDEKMYFPHNLDFRGRAYTIPPYFNHIGNDLCRGLLLFHHGKPLGQRGLSWLKIHLASLCGYDKASFAEREDYAMKNLDNIYDSVRNPLDGRRWWAGMDDPWQCLAACIELVGALESPDPTSFISHLPIQQDGTCNGLQHYAALGGDLAGAKQVNLEPSDRPQDVYTGVSLLVNDIVEKDAAEGNDLAKKLVGKITRKVVKQTVMTNVYGVTFVGARAQIFNQLKARGDIDKEDLFPLSAYLAHRVFRSLRTMFSGAHKIQDWLGNCAKLIAKSVDPSSSRFEFMSSVTWTTPMGLPVVQPYRKSSQKQIQTNLQSVFLSDPNSVKEVNSRKQCSAFPPNFIHSLDATHMMMSALACSQANIEFAAVHDSYWTHACDVDTMNTVLRDAFIKLHSEDIMSKLRDEFHQRYGGFKALLSVPANSTVGKNITKRRKTSRRRRVTAQEELADIIKGKLPSYNPKELDLSSAIAAKSEQKETTDEDGVSDTSEGATDLSKKKSGRCVAWFDMEFPELPERGEFDVRKLKQSQYFFS